MQKGRISLVFYPVVEHLVARREVVLVWKVYKKWLTWFYLKKYERYTFESKLHLFAFTLPLFSPLETGKFSMIQNSRMR